MWLCVPVHASVFVCRCSLSLALYFAEMEEDDILRRHFKQIKLKEHCSNHYSKSECSHIYDSFYFYIHFMPMIKLPAFHFVKRKMERERESEKSNFTSILLHLTEHNRPIVWVSCARIYYTTFFVVVLHQNHICIPTFAKLTSERTKIKTNTNKTTNGLRQFVMFILWLISLMAFHFATITQITLAKLPLWTITKAIILTYIKELHTHTHINDPNHLNK